MLRIANDVVMVYFTVLSQHSLGWSHGYHEEPFSRQPIKSKSKVVYVPN